MERGTRIRGRYLEQKKLSSDGDDGGVDSGRAFACDVIFKADDVIRDALQLQSFAISIVIEREIGLGKK